MSLKLPPILEALEGAKPRVNTPTGPCKLQRILDEIPAGEEGRDDLIAAVVDREKYSSRTISIVFEKLGHVVHRDLVNNHRATPQRCRCGK